MVTIPITKKTVYRDSNGNEFDITKMDDEQLINAFYDMLMRKAKHNHKLNKMMEVGDILSEVAKTLHQEMSTRTNSGIPYVRFQAAADQGRLYLESTETEVHLKETK